MSADELSAVFGVSPQTVRDLARRGVIARAGKTFPVAESFRRYAAHLRAGAAARAGPGSGELAKQRARKARLEADQLEREASVSSGAMVPVADYEESMTAICRGLRVLMMSVPSRLSGRAPHLDRADIELVDDAIRDALTEASQMDLPRLRKVCDAKALA